MKLSIPAGTTSKRIAVFLQDSSSVTGAGLTGLVFNTSSLVCYSWIDTDGNVGGTSQALQSATLGTWTTRGFKEKDATNLPGWYEIGVPDALLAAGVKWAVLHFKGATNLAPCPIEIEVTAVSNQDAVRGGLTALPNANAEAAGGLYTRGTGAGQINQQTNGQVDANLERWINVAPLALSSQRVQVLVGAITNGVLVAATFGANALDAVWTTAARLLTAGTNIVLAKGVGVTGFTDLDASAVTAAVPTAIQNADAHLDRANAIETGLTPRQAQKLTTAALAGKLSGAATATVTIRNAAADSKDRIVATVDANGNRSAITLDVT